MAEIAMARDTSSPAGRLVALKRILPHLCSDPHYRAMFTDEARVLSQLEHPSIVRAYEVGEIDSTPFIALEYVSGQDAREVFHACLRQGQPLPLGLACYVIQQLCAGLQHAHDQTDAQGQSLGVVHRDVSLQNILVGYDGEVKLTDFGIAASAENHGQTQAGVVKGKFGYMSPEQVRGGVVDRRSDVFSAGICLYELLTGERLFSGESDYKAIERVRNVAVEPPSHFNRQIPSSLEAIVMKALAKNPRDRYQSANELRGALEGFLVEVRLSIGRADLGAYMRELFAHEYAGAAASALETGAAPPTEQTPSPDDEPTTATDQPFDDEAEKTEVVSESLMQTFTEELEASGALQSADDAPTATGPRPAEAAAHEPNPAGDFEDDAATMMYSAARHSAGDTDRHAPYQAPAPPDTSARTGLAHAPSRLQMVWEDEPTTALQRDRLTGFSPAAAAPAALSNDAVFEIGPDPAAGPSARPRSSRAASGPMAALPTLELQPPPASRYRLALVPVLGALVMGLVIYVMRDRGDAALYLEAEPSNATLLVDGQVVQGQGPNHGSPFLVSDLPTGSSHTVVVTRPGFDTWSTTLRLPPNKTLRLPTVRLAFHADPGPRREPESDDARPNTQDVTPSAESTARATTTTTAQVESPPPERAEPRPRRSHAQSDTRAEAAAARTPRRSTSSAENPAPHERTREPTPAKAPSVAGGTGILRINTRPWSHIVIDGVDSGNTPQMRLQLSAGKHTVVLSNPEFGVKKSLVVTIPANETVTKVLDLTGP